MKIHAESHLDHHLTPEQIRHIEERFAGRAEFFIETIELPDELGMVPCGLHGPVMGDAPVPDAEVTRAKRGDRAYTSRLCDRTARQTNKVTVIAGPHEETCPRCNGTKIWYGHSIPPDNGPWHCNDCDDHCKVQHACILYTSFGGPQAPQEPGDIRAQLEAAELERRERDQRDGDPAAGVELPLPVATREYEDARAAVDPIYAKIVGLRRKREASDAFWRDHALSK